MIPALLQGRDCTDKGIIQHKRAGPFWGLALSRGLDSPAPKQDPNEDACGVVTSPACSVAVVADAHFGRQSAEIAVDALLATAVRSPPEQDAVGWLRTHLADIHQRVLPGSSACALLAVVVQGDQLSWISIGDCRLYRLRSGQTAVLNPMVGRYLGDWGTLLMESGEQALHKGDRIIMASDGLPECRYGVPTLSDHEVGQIAADRPPEDAAVALAEAALARGGEDNIAIVLLAHG